VPSKNYASYTLLHIKIEFSEADGIRLQHSHASTWGYIRTYHTLMHTQEYTYKPTHRHKHVTHTHTHTHIHITLSHTHRHTHTQLTHTHTPVQSPWGLTPQWTPWYVPLRPPGRSGRHQAPAMKTKPRLCIRQCLYSVCVRFVWVGHGRTYVCFKLQDTRCTKRAIPRWDILEAMRLTRL